MLMVICTLPSKTLRRLPPFAYSQEVIISHWFRMERVKKRRRRGADWWSDRPLDIRLPYDALKRPDAQTLYILGA